jgi:hypothetical protein
MHLNGTKGSVVSTLSSGRVAVELKDKHSGQYSFAPENLTRVKRPKAAKAAPKPPPPPLATAQEPKNIFGRLLEGAGDLAATAIARLKGEVQAETDALEKDKLKKKLRRQMKLKEAQEGAAAAKSAHAATAATAAQGEAPALATAGWHGIEYSPAYVTKEKKFFGQGAERVVFQLKLEYRRRLKKTPKKKKHGKRDAAKDGKSEPGSSIVEFLVAKEGRFHEDLKDSFQFHRQFAETQLVRVDA